MQLQDLHSCIGVHHGVQEVDPLISVSPKAGLLEEKPLENFSWLYQKLIVIIVMLMDRLIKAALWTRHWPGAMGSAVQGQATAAHHTTN